MPRRVSGTSSEAFGGVLRIVVLVIVDRLPDFKDGPGVSPTGSVRVEEMRSGIECAHFPRPDRSWIRASIVARGTSRRSLFSMSHRVKSSSIVLVPLRIDLARRVAPLAEAQVAEPVAERDPL